MEIYNLFNKSLKIYIKILPQINIKGLYRENEDFVRAIKEKYICILFSN